MIERVPMAEVIEALHANGLPGYVGKPTDTFVQMGSRWWELEYYETRSGNRMIAMNFKMAVFTRHKTLKSAALKIVECVRDAHRETGRLLECPKCRK